MLPGLIGDDPEMLAEFIGEYLVSLGASTDESRAALARGDWAGAGGVAHRLKSSSRSVGAMAVGECCEHIETAGKAGDGARMVALMAGFEAAAQALRGRMAAGRDGQGGRPRSGPTADPGTTPGRIGWTIAVYGRGDVPPRFRPRVSPRDGRVLGVLAIDPEAVHIDARRAGGIGSDALPGAAVHAGAGADALPPPIFRRMHSRRRADGTTGESRCRSWSTCRPRRSPISSFR